jgi:DNA-binding CsgD family transcriptional regulator
MARKEIRMEELIEVLYQWHKGRNISQIKRSLGLDRKTIRKYIELAEPYGFLREDEVRDDGYYMQLAGRIQSGLKTPLGCSASFKKTALYQPIIEKLLTRKYMTPKQAYRILKRDHEYPLSYSSFKRYIHIKYPKEPRNCLRIEVRAGEEAQVDFGSAGMMRGGFSQFLLRGIQKVRIEWKIGAIAHNLLKIAGLAKREREITASA